MIRRWPIPLGLCVAFLLASTTAAAQRPPKKTVTIGVVVDGPWDANRVWLTEVVQAIKKLTKNEFQIEFPADKRLIADWTRAKVKAHFDTLMADPKVKLVLALGVLASQEAGRRKVLRKPVIAPFVLDVKLQGMPYKKGTSGRHNLNYLVLPWQFDRNMAAFLEVVPFTRLTVLSSQKYLTGIPQLRTRLVASAKRRKLKMTVVPVGSSVEQALAAIPADTQAVYVAPLPHLPAAEWDRLIAGVNKRKLPTFSHVGRAEVDRGVLISLSPYSTRKRIARRVAVHVQRTLQGEDPRNYPVVTRQTEQLAINMKTARQIGVWPSWTVLTEAELVGRTRTGISRTVSLESVAKQALAGNINYDAAKILLQANNQRVKLARSNLLPQLSVSTSGVLIDRDRATATLSAQHRYTWTADATFRQILFSEKAWAGYTVQKHLQRSRVHDLDAMRLDTVVAAAVAYLNVLAAKSFERIRAATLRNTRANLDLARTRLALGFASKAEVYRWDVKIAIDRKAVIDSSAQRRVAEIQLNRVLNRPLEEPFRTAAPTMNAKSVLAAQTGLFAHLNNPWSFKIFRRFLVRKGIAASPEIRSIDAALAAQRRLVVSKKRAYYAPTVGLQASLTQIVGRAGASSSGLDLGLPPNMTPSIVLPNDTNWQVGISVSIPLFLGGSRKAELGRADLVTRRLLRKRAALVQAIDQRIRSQGYKMGASFASIRLSRQAAAAADKNLELVTDAYARGVASILDLIDAQNAARVAALRTAAARYTFLIDWMNTQRAIGQFDFATDSAGRAAFLRELNAFASANKPR